ncbi:hypothetical protein CCR85_00935 [Rhodothalassium salexigens]|uniref:head-tail connector protein n=1 Tax=Rhodothalassium salexigens TaxID=1086 RepID=UPI001911C526|nr:hypothetical protein [Rhodothalassium salexigens]MBK5910058.1 hypothetical protein [Rhodothalassium salexigens]MBK5921533.1 hypothetical protein [Rhodothalassium salexigens]
MSASLKRIVAPAAPAVATQAVAAHLRLEDADAIAELEPLITQATEALERHLRRALIEQRFRLRLGQWPLGAVRLPRPPLIAVDTVTVTDAHGTEQPVDPALYHVDTDAEPGLLTPVRATALPAPQGPAGAVTLTFTAGYGAGWNQVPDDLRGAIVMTVAHWYDRRDGDTALPPGARALVAGYRMIGL